jgi:hypothetical protein
MRKPFVAVNKTGTTEIGLRLWVQKWYRTAENRSASLLPYINGTGTVLLKRGLRLRYRTEMVPYC